MSKIIVIGAGHGGLVAAAKLAKSGNQVIVFEKRKIDKIGYDFTDVFRADCLKKVGIDFDETKLEIKSDMTFISPSLQKSLTPHIPEKFCEKRIERKKLYEVLIDFAKNSGVEICESTEINEFLFDENNKIIGVKSKSESYFADLVIDSAGLNFSARKQLEDKKLLNFETTANDRFFCYRATFEKKASNDKAYKVYFLPKNIQGISWVVELDNEIDVLIGAVNKLNSEKIDEILAFMRQNNPCIGEKLLRAGGSFEIPINQPLSKFFCDNYVLVGDSAKMTVPVIASGITNSILAGDMLAENLLKFGLNNQALWRYQVEYFKNFAWEDAGLNQLKNILLLIDAKSLDFMFNKGVLNENDLLVCCAGKQLKLNFLQLMSKGFKGIGYLKLMLKFAKGYFHSLKKAKICKQIPLEYDLKKITKWQKKYLKF